MEILVCSWNRIKYFFLCKKKISFFNFFLSSKERRNHKRNWQFKIRFKIFSQNSIHSLFIELFINLFIYLFIYFIHTFCSLNSIQFNSFIHLFFKTIKLVGSSPKQIILLLLRKVIHPPQILLIQFPQRRPTIPLINRPIARKHTPFNSKQINHF